MVSDPGLPTLIVTPRTHAPAMFSWIVASTKLAEVKVTMIRSRPRRRAARRQRADAEPHPSGRLLVRCFRDRCRATARTYVPSPIAWLRAPRPGVGEPPLT